ncbi:MAG: pilus assembly protein PilN [Desulfobacteraceae bacterium]|nr:pilus assembly protein PilN [Desulfobacteraceae bacterium]
MIRINLLPFRVARKKENIRRQISVFLLLILLVCAALFGIHRMVSQKILIVKENTKQVKQQISKYKEKADRVAKIKKDLKVLKDKLAIVKSLEGQREKQLILFDGMTNLIIPERMWLESFKTDNNTVIIKGIAFDNPTIADFMKKLEGSPLFNKVDLRTAKMKKFKGNIELKSFELLCRKTKKKAKKKTVPKQGRK